MDLGAFRRPNGRNTGSRGPPLFQRRQNGYHVRFFCFYYAKSKICFLNRKCIIKCRILRKHTGAVVGFVLDIMLCALMLHHKHIMSIFRVYIPEGPTTTFDSKNILLVLSFGHVRARRWLTQAHSWHAEQKESMFHIWKQLFYVHVRNWNELSDIHLSSHFSYPKSILTVNFTWNCEGSFVLQDPWFALQKRDFLEQKIVRNGISEISCQLRTWT